MVKKSKTVSNTAVNRMHRATDFNLKSTRTRWGSISIPQPHSRVRESGEWQEGREGIIHNLTTAPLPKVTKLIG